MTPEERRKLESVGHAADILGMTDEERAGLARWEASEEGPDAILARRVQRDVESNPGKTSIGSELAILTDGKIKDSRGAGYKSS